MRLCVYTVARWVDTVRITASKRCWLGLETRASLGWNTGDQVCVGPLHLLFGRILYISNMFLFNFLVGSEVESEPYGQVLADSLGVSAS